MTQKAFNDVKELKGFTISVVEKLKKYNFKAHIPRYLIENYGQQAMDILNSLFQLKTEEDPELSLLKAELAFCIQHEMVCTLQDFFVRRTGLMNFDIHRVIRWKQEIAQECKTYFNWDDRRLSRELDSLNFLLASSVNFRTVN